MDDTDYISEDQAAAVWHRAAHLQAQAVTRLESRSRELARAGEPQAEGAEGYRMGDVRAAAVQAGIAAEFVAAALAEVASADAAGPSTPARDRLAGMLLGTRARRLEVARSIQATPAAVLEGMRRVLPAPPFSLSLSDSVGADPLAGGVLVFELPPTSAFTAGMPYTAAAVDVKHLRFTIRTLPGDDSRCELTVAADLRRSVRRNGTAALVAGGTLAAGAGFLGGALGVGVLAMGALAALPAAAAAAAVGSAGAFGYGLVYRYYLRSFTADLDRILRAVDANARTGGAFAPPAGGAVAGGGSEIVAALSVIT